MNPEIETISGKLMRITVDSGSEHADYLQSAWHSGTTLTVEIGGRTITGALVTSMESCNGATTFTIEKTCRAVKDSSKLSFCDENTYGTKPNDKILRTRYDLRNESVYHVEELQKRLIELGAKWSTIGTRAAKPRRISTEKMYLYVNHKGLFSSSKLEKRFNESRYTLLDYNDVISIQQGKLTPEQKRARIAEAYGMGTQRLDALPQLQKSKLLFGDLSKLEKRVAEYMRHEGTITGRITGDELKPIYGGIMKSNWKFKSVHPKDIDFEELGESVTRQNPLAIVKGAYKSEQVGTRHVLTATGNIVYSDGTVRNNAGELVIAEITPAQHQAVELGGGLGKAVPKYETFTKPVTVDENYVVVHKSLYDKSLVVAIQPPTAEGKYKWLATQNGGRVYGNIPTPDLRKWVKWAKDVKAATWHDEDRRKVTFEVNLPTI